MTVRDLIDYLQSFPGDTEVVWSEEDVETPMEFLALDSIDLDYVAEPAADGS